MTTKPHDPGKNRTCDLRFRNALLPHEVVGKTSEINQRASESTALPHNKPTTSNELIKLPGWIAFAVNTLIANRRDDEDGCSYWLSVLTKEGYPRVKIAGKQYPAHRLTAALYYGPEAIRGKDIHHLCERKDCVRPDHLIPVTNSEHAKIHKGAPIPSAPPRCAVGYSAEAVIEVSLRVSAAPTSEATP